MVGIKLIRQSAIFLIKVLWLPGAMVVVYTSGWWSLLALPAYLALVAVLFGTLTPPRAVALEERVAPPPFPNGASPLQVLEAARSEAFRDPDTGDALALELDPPAVVDWPVPDPIRQLQSYAGGCAVADFRCVWTNDPTAAHGFEEAFPRVSYVADDMTGNHWAVEIHPNGEWGGVWFFCHDPPEIVRSGESLAWFLHASLNCFRKGVDYLLESRICRADAELPTAASLRASGDPAIRAVLAQARDDDLVADVRSERLGVGFPWKPGQSIIRPTTEPIFLLRSPARGR